MAEAIEPVEKPLEDEALPARIREVFVMFDDDNSGFLSADELHKLLKKLSAFKSEHIAAFCEDIDKSKDGKVSYGELVYWCQKSGGAGGEKVAKAIIRETNKRAVRMKASFDRYDNSGDGSLDLPELTKVLKTLGAFTINEIKNVLADLDSNGDGDISFPEFADWVRRPTKKKDVLKAKCMLAPSDSDGLEAVFYNFCGPGHADLDGKSFIKLLKDCGILGKSKLTPTRVDLIFSDTKVKPKFERRIDFSQFGVALELVSEEAGITVEYVHEAMQNQTHPVLKGTKAEYTRFHDDSDGKKAAALKAAAEAAVGAQGITTRQKGRKPIRMPGDLPIVKHDPNAPPADNTKLWKVFGCDTPAGRSLKRVYTNVSPQKTLLRHSPWKANWPPEQDTYVAVNGPGVDKFGIKFRRSMYLSDVCNDSLAVIPWGASIKGEMVTACWLKVGDRFLPTTLNGVHVMRRWPGPGPHPYPFDLGSIGLCRSSSLPMIREKQRAFDLKGLPCSLTV